MVNIGLNSSMQNNLLSLQSIAGQQSLTQNKLATGLKVNSATDNPSSYFSASSLKNKANDLSALLDSMTQGIQTIKSATESLRMGRQFLEQSKALANTADAINSSLLELEKAIGQLRGFENKFGNHFSIVENRNDFTEKMIDVLSEGADKLTLADMNEESANMLALKTRQMLAVNSLSLASQSRQSILSLF